MRERYGIGMKEVRVVIGKNFGDEGKGQVVNDLCREAVHAGKKVMVVRHNGGAQAGHTVEEGGFRFVFHQLGSGSRQGAGVCWSHTFLPDLVKLGDEEEMFMQEMEASGSPCEPVPIYADGMCRCTTIYDVLLNSLAEDLRSSGHHGSCGMGIYEAVLRSRKEKDTIRLKDLEGKTPLEITEMLLKLRDGYVQVRLGEICRECGLKPSIKQEGSNEHTGRLKNDWYSLKENDWYSLIYDDQVLVNSADRMWENFNRYVILTDIDRLLEDTDTVIFENAQGLLLDEDNQEYFPHLTPSHTGLFNIAAYLRDVGMLQGVSLPCESGNGTRLPHNAGMLQGERLPCKSGNGTRLPHNTGMPQDGTLPGEGESHPVVGLRPSDSAGHRISRPGLEVHYVTRTYVTRHGAGRLEHECRPEHIPYFKEDRTNRPNRWQESLRYAWHPSLEEFLAPILWDLTNLPRDCPYSVSINLDITHLDESGGRILFCDGARETDQVELYMKERIQLPVRVIKHGRPGVRSSGDCE